VNALDGSQVDFREKQMDGFRYTPRPSRLGLPQGASGYMHPKVALALKKVSEVGGNFTLREFEVGSGASLFGPNQSVVRINDAGRLYEYRVKVASGKAPDASALRLAEAITKRQVSKLPEGRFFVSDQSYGPYTHVTYREVAFGYDYYENQKVCAEFNKDGKLALFLVDGDQPRPTGVPSNILTAKEIEGRLTKKYLPKLPKNTDTVTYKLVIQAGKKFWYYFPKDKKLHFIYAVSIGQFMNIKDRGGRGGGSVVPVDAVTGQELIGY
jgi:hypothetical protein